jgi:hypothetical protein
MTPVPPVSERRLRHVAVSWTALGQATACQYSYNCDAETKAQGRVDNLGRVEAMMELSSLDLK